jgi:hypothetical protein
MRVRRPRNVELILIKGLIFIVHIILLIKVRRTLVLSKK